ncbi:MAG: Holliday junction resolvase RuvX [Flavobacteriales bacterium]
MRVLAIDFGLKRTGLAVTDPVGIIASALETVPSAELMAYLKRYVAKEAVQGFVVGLPCNLDGTPTDITKNVVLFVAALKEAFPKLWVETMDERFTSTIAHRTMLESGIGRMARRDKGTVDRISATIILQGWMDRKRR